VRRADQLLEQLDADRQALARQVFLQLVHIGTGQVSRRRVPVRELLDLDLDAVALTEVLDGFARHRLLTYDRDEDTGGGTVEVAHEALLREWPRLAGWIDEQRDDVVRREALAAAVGDWEASGRQDDYLLTGARLDGFAGWAASTGMSLTAAERGLIEASTTLRTETERNERERRARETALTRRSRRRTWALAAAVAVATAAATVAVLALRPEQPPDVVLVVDPVADPDIAPLVTAGMSAAVAEAGVDVSSRQVFRAGAALR
jgi:hypothetical protein